MPPIFAGSLNTTIGAVASSVRCFAHTILNGLIITGRRLWSTVTAGDASAHLGAFIITGIRIRGRQRCGGEGHAD